MYTQVYGGDVKIFFEPARKNWSPLVSSDLMGTVLKSEAVLASFS